MTTGIVRTIDISYTAPQPPIPRIPRPNLIQTILQLFAGNTDAVCVEAQSGHGKTTLLLEFASTAASPCFCAFLKPSSRLSYDPVLVRADLANQAFWYLRGTRLPHDREPTDGELRTLWSRCARLLLRKRTAGYINGIRISLGVRDFAPVSDQADRKQTGRARIQACTRAREIVTVTQRPKVTLVEPFDAPNCPKLLVIHEPLSA